MPSPPRSAAFYIPRGSGLTHGNVRRLNLLYAIYNNLPPNAARNFRYSNILPILHRVRSSGMYGSLNQTEAAVRHYVNRLRRLRGGLNRRSALRPFVPGASRFSAGRWQKVRTAAGRFKALRSVRALRVPNRPSTNQFANLMTPYMLGIADPVGVSERQYERAEEQAERSARAASRRRSATRGRRSARR